MAVDGHGKIEGTKIEDPDLRRRILRACSRMPYSPSMNLGRLQAIGSGGESGCTLEALTDWLEQFAEVLIKHAAESYDRDEELRQSKRDILGVARVVDLVLSESKTVEQIVGLVDAAIDAAEEPRT